MSVAIRRYIGYLKKEMQQMECNWSSCVVEILLGRITLVGYLL